MDHGALRGLQYLLRNSWVTQIRYPLYTSKWPVLTLRPTCKNRNKHSDINQNWIATMSKLKQMSMICLHILKIPNMFSCCKKFITCKRTLELYEHQWLGHVLVISSDQRHIFKYLFIITSLKDPSAYLHLICL